MKRAGILVVICLVLAFVGCATVKVQAPKEPIKVDISMRLDVYQHVQKDIDAIEDIVTGAGDTSKPQSFMGFLTATAYAQNLSPELENAALRRKARYNELTSLEAAGVVGETRDGLVAVRGSSDARVEQLVKDENQDRMIIYDEIAFKNGTSVEDVQKIYAERLQQSAPSGTPIETKNGTWETK